MGQRRGVQGEKCAFRQIFFTRLTTGQYLLTVKGHRKDKSCGQPII